MIFGSSPSLGTNCFLRIFRPFNGISLVQRKCFLNHLEI